jgi:hypothetical protein
MTIDPFVLVAPVLLLLIVGLLRFVGCNTIWGLGDVVESKPEIISSRQMPAQTIETTNSDSIAAQFGIPVMDGSLFIVWLFYESAALHVQEITDNAMNAYQLAVGPTTGSGQQSGLRQEIWYAANVNGTPTAPDTRIQVTARFTAPFNARKAIVAHEYTGAQRVSPLDQVAANVGTTTANDLIVRTEERMVVKAELVFAAAVFHGTFGTPGPGFNERSMPDNNLSEDMIAPTGELIGATFQTQPMTDWVAQMVTFRAQDDA